MSVCKYATMVSRTETLSVASRRLCCVWFVSQSHSTPSVRSAVLNNLPPSSTRCPAEWKASSRNHPPSLAPTQPSPYHPILQRSTHMRTKAAGSETAAVGPSPNGPRRGRREAARPPQDLAPSKYLAIECWTGVGYLPRYIHT